MFRYAMSLELYERFERQTSVDLGREEGRAIGSYCSMIIDRLLRHLKRIADAGNIDGWLDYVDPELTYWENKANLKDKAGATGFDSPFKSERKKWRSDMLGKEEEYEERHKDEDSEAPRGSVSSAESRPEPESKLGKWAVEHHKDRPRSGDGGEEIFLSRKRERTWEDQHRDWQH